MIWPSPKEFSDAVRNPAAAFADPDLATTDAVLGADGRPELHAGSFSHVYQLCAEDGSSWAVKCFNRIDDAREARYAAIRDALTGQPFAVGFGYLADGALVAGRRWPVLKMDWVEGASLYRIAKDRADSPAVMDGLFKRWVQLSRELHAAGIAHGDLQHANVLLVPGKWPGAYTLKLIDYDAMYLPALANAPTYEVGHPNYQHPERNERSYSPDLDRFPLLVVATALKALAVRGPDLWRAYGSRDSLLFTAADFRAPAESRLMRKLWKSDDPALRALVGKLTLACGQPLSHTPWLDDLCANGNPALTAEEVRAVDATLRPNTPSMAAFTLDDEPVVAQPVAAFTLDDDPAPPRSAPAASKRAKPLTPVPVVTDEDEEEDDEDPRPRRKGKRRPEPARGFPLIAVAVVAALMMLVGGAVAALLVWRANRPDETAQPDEPVPQPAPQPAPSPAPTPQPVPPTKPEPPEPPFVGPPGFHRVWVKPSGDARGNVRPFFATAGRAAYVGGEKRLDAFDAKTGDPLPAFRGEVPAYTLGLWTLDRDRVAVFGFPHKAPRLWDAKTGDPLPFLARDPLPPAPPGVNDGVVECQLSPDGRYVFAGYQGPFRGGAHAPAPYRVVEVATGNVVTSGDWTFGTVRFADGKLLMAEMNGRVRWVNLKNGETDIEWAFAPGPPRLGGVSNDGSLFVYLGRPSGMPLDCYLMDGKTGQALRRVGPHFSGDRGVLSADGRYLAGVTNEPPTFREFFAVVADARTGEVLVRTPLEGTMNDLQRAGFSSDGKKFLLHHRGKNEVQAFELRGAIPNGSAPLPTPVGPVPARARPGAAAVAPPVPPPQPPNGFPDAPALKPLWKAAVGGAAANQLPQAPLFTKDGATVVLSGGASGSVLTFDAQTGDAGVTFDGHKGPGGVYWVVPVGNDRVVSGGFDGKQTTWDVRTGKPLDAVKFPDLPPLPPGQAGHAGITYAVSPGGRYAVQARREAARPTVPGPLRVLDATTGKTAVSADWNGGRVLFAADESRVLVLDGLGKATWYKLPSGEADGGWACGEGVRAEHRLRPAGRDRPMRRIRPACRDPDFVP